MASHDHVFNFLVINSTNQHTNNGCAAGEPAYRSLRRLCTVCHRVGVLARFFLSSGSNLAILFSVLSKEARTELRYAQILGLEVVLHPLSAS